MSKVAQLMSKIETFHSLSVNKVITDERLQVALAEGIEKGEIKPISETKFAEKSADLLAFAKKFGLVSAPTKRSSGTGHRIGMLALVKEQYPDVLPLIEASNKLAEMQFKIQTPDGEILVEYQPFMRDITPKADATSATV